MRLRSSKGRRHLVIPDLQTRPGVSIRHIFWLAYFAMDKLTNDDVVVQVGDWGDMPSFSDYDRAGGKMAEGRRWQADFDSVNRSLDIVGEIWDKRGFDPEKHLTLGNHEYRVVRAVNNDARLDGLVGLHLFNFEDYGWKVHGFLEKVKIDGISYSHFHPENAGGKVTQTRRGAPSARAQAQRQMCSATAGHQQGLDVAVVPTSDGLRRGLIAGSFYLHDEEYMGPLNNYWRGVLLKNDVHRGDYCLTEVDVHYLARTYRKYEPPGRKVA